MKINIVGASHFVNRMFQACGTFQWARELTRNSIEAGATRIDFGIEWQAVEKLGVYRRMVVDNGVGMDSEELRRFFSTLGEGAKKIGGVHDNFGVGAKIATLPWNPEGVVVVSYKNGRASMIWIVHNPDNNEYELTEFETETGITCVIDPKDVDWSDDVEVDWGAICPQWVGDHGTIVVLLGSESNPDTVLGNPFANEQDIKGLSVYLNTRFWDLKDNEVFVTEVRSKQRNKWPAGPDDCDDSRRPNRRRIRGAHYYLTEIEGKKGELSATDLMLIDDDRVALEWYLWKGERPAIHSYAKKGGYVAIRYKDELFHLTTSKVTFRQFGVIEAKVQQNLTIVLDPAHYSPKNGRWGVHPDQSRNRLIFTGNGENGVELPISDWGLEFAENIPEPVMQAIRAVRGQLSASLENEEYRKRLQDKFGNRWSTKVHVKGIGPGESMEVTESDEGVELYDEPRPIKTHSHRKKPHRVMVVRKKVTLNGPDQGIEAEVPVDVPRYRFAGKEEFEKPWHLALWAPTDPDGPTVLLNHESPILEEIVQYHQNRYPDVYAEDVGNIVRQVFGEVATCKVAHSQKLAKQISEDELNQLYRSEHALTVALMGLVAEESLIIGRLARFGRARSAA